MIRPILQAPDPRLQLVSEPMPEKPEAIHRLVIKCLLDTFNATENCIGLAAPQLDFQWRAIIIDTSESRSQMYIMVNPVITKMSEGLQLVNDGCMSVKQGRTRAKTKRPKRLVVEWIDPLTWEKKHQRFSGLEAACIHHEIDHLDGVLFVDRIMAAVAAEHCIARPT